MQRHVKVANAIQELPMSIWGEPALRSWDPDEETKTIAAYRLTISVLKEITDAIAVLAEYEYPLHLSMTCIGASILAERKSTKDPRVIVTVNEGLLDAVSEYCGLAPGGSETDDIVILAILEATAEFLGVRLVEEIDFLDYITEEMPTENE